MISDAGNDQSSGCQGEPDWVTNVSAQKEGVCDGAPVKFLTDRVHCGRCNHSCLEEQCVEGICAERKDDTEAMVIFGVRNGAVYYARRPGGSFFSNQPQEMKRFVPGLGAVLLGRMEADAGDAGDERRILGASPGADFVYVRAAKSLRRVSATEESTAVPERVAALPGELRLVDGRFYWLAQSFIFFTGNASSVYEHAAGQNKPLFESQDKVGGLAIDGNAAYVMRAGKAGAIVRIDLTTGATDQFFSGDLDNSILAIDVAAVRIAKHPHTYRLALLGDRVFLGAEDGLYSVAK